MLTIGTDEAGVMRNQNHGAIFAFFKKLNAALLLKAGIPHGHNFVDQKTIKLNHHGDGESQPCAHTRRVSFNRLIQILTQLGEFLNEGNPVLRAGAVYAANESQVIQAGQAALKSSAKSQRPRHADISTNTARGWLLCPADQSN